MNLSNITFRSWRQETLALSFFLASCVARLFHIHLTLKYQPGTLLSLVNGSPRPTAFITEILCCQVALYTCHRGLKGTAPDPLLHNTAWFFIALRCMPFHHCFQPYVNIIHSPQVWQQIFWWEGEKKTLQLIVVMMPCLRNDINTISIIGCLLPTSFNRLEKVQFMENE